MTARRARAALTGVLVVLLSVLTACSGGPRTTWVWPSHDGQAQGPGPVAPVVSPGASGSAAPTPSTSVPPAGNVTPLNSPVIINQSRTGPAERRLAVERDGSWACDNCAGDGKSAGGRLTAAQMKQLQTYLDDPAFEGEDGVPPTSPKCTNKLDSNMTTTKGIVLWSNCRGGGPPPVSVKILRLLAEATPLNAGLPG